MKMALSFYHRSKDARQNAENGVILRPEVEGCEGERKGCGGGRKKKVREEMGEERWRREGGEMIIPWGKRGNNGGVKEDWSSGED